MNTVLKMKIEKCMNCRFWQQPDMNPEWGYCHRYPPTAEGEEIEFPVTSVGTWCGEWHGRTNR